MVEEERQTAFYGEGVLVATATVSVTPSGGGGSYLLTNISSVGFSWGRRNILDEYSGLTAVAYGFNPSAWASSPKVGDKVVMTVLADQSGSGTTSVTGWVSDYSVRYGQKTTIDTWELSIEGPFISGGRTYGSITTSAGASVSLMGSSIATLVNTVSGAPTFSVSGGSSTTSAQTITDTAADMASLWCRTEGGTIVEYDQYAQLTDRNTMNATTGTFTDVPGDGNFKYTELVFRSAADNYSTKIVVQPSGLAAQTSGSGAYTQQVATINSTTGEAANLAGYYKLQTDLSTSVPSSITYTDAVNPGNGLGVNDALQWANYPNGAVNITFRGSTYKTIAIGADLSADASDFRVTLYLVSSLADAFLVLNSSALGILNTNKLGF